MTEEQAFQLKEKIEKRIRQTQEEISDLRIQTKPIAPENSIGRLSRLDAINNKSVVEAALRGSEKKLQDLEFNLGKYGRPEFGRCNSCGDDIQYERLLFMPESLYCMGCARKKR